MRILRATTLALALGGLATGASAQQTTTGEIVGGLVGAVAGGVVGNQFGGGSGNTLATIGGAVVGGAVGYGVGGNLERNGTFTGTQPAPSYGVQPAYPTTNVQTYRDPYQQPAYQQQPVYQQPSYQQQQPAYATTTYAPSAPVYPDQTYAPATTYETQVYDSYSQPTYYAEPTTVDSYGSQPTYQPY